MPFAILGPAPVFKNVASMVDQGDGWIIDPWAGIAAPPNKYAEMVTKVANDWQRRGLRIGQIGKRERAWKDPQTWVQEQIKIGLVTYTSAEKFK